MKSFPEIEGVAFGLVDGIVLVMGIIIGVWAATNHANTIILAALVGGITNAFGNAAGVFLAQTAERGVQLESQKRKVKREVHSKQEVLKIALSAFAFSILTVVIITLPFYALSVFQATLASSAVALAMLFWLGRYVGRLSRENPFKYGAMYVFIGLLAALVAFLVGEGLKALLV